MVAGPVIAAGDGNVFLAMVSVLAVLVPQLLFAVTLKVPFAVKFGV